MVKNMVYQSNYKRGGSGTTPASISDFTFYLAEMGSNVVPIAFTVTNSFEYDGKPELYSADFFTLGRCITHCTSYKITWYH